MPSYIGYVYIGEVNDNAVVQFGDCIIISPKSREKSREGSGTGNTGSLPVEIRPNEGEQAAEANKEAKAASRVWRKSARNGVFRVTGTPGRSIRIAPPVRRT